VLVLLVLGRQRVVLRVLVLVLLGLVRVGVLLDVLGVRVGVLRVPLRRPQLQRRERLCQRLRGRRLRLRLGMCVCVWEWVRVPVSGDGHCDGHPADGVQARDALGLGLRGGRVPWLWVRGLGLPRAGWL
jgi:hypothetical protein